MQRFSTFLFTAAILHGGVVQGIALEQVSGRPLARTLVRLEPAPQPGGSRLRTLTVRAGRAGQFEFGGVAPGIYLLTAVKEGYLPAAYGARVSGGAGTPVEITADSHLFAEVRLRHRGALMGRVLDENGVGAAGVGVIAYRARLPLRSAGNAMSDDRGVFRIAGLTPGKYWVRSAAEKLEDGTGWLPTYATQARESRDARIYQVNADAEATDIDISPEPGTLFRVGGRITCDIPQALEAVTVVLSSETGRRRTQTGCAADYRFEDVAPGQYEVFASVNGTDGPHAGYTELYLDHDSDAVNIQVLQLPIVEIEVRLAGRSTAPDIPVHVIGRRQDLSETEGMREIVGSRIALAPGHWEFRAEVPAGDFVESIGNLYTVPRRIVRAERPAEWFDVFIEPHARSRIRITVSDQTGQIGGRVTADGQAVAAMPVFVWPVAESVRRSLGGAVTKLSDTEGRFRFDSLPPGDYRVVASFDIAEIDEEMVETSHALSVRVEPSQTAAIDLTPWMAP
jgi:hypothetical protein